MSGIEVLGVVASGIAVFQFAVQLTEAAVESHKFLKDIENAPKELERLIDLLWQLCHLLEGVKNVLTSQRDRSVDGEFEVSSTISSALKGCRDQMQPLTNIVLKTTSRTADGSKTRFTKTWASLRLRLEKADIHECEERLCRAITMLNTTMTLNLWSLR